jgi:hypothetical protein
MDWSANEIVWKGASPSTDIITKVRSEMVADLRDLGKPEDLIFHTVFLDENDFAHGPCVIVWGEDGDDRFHAEYHASSAYETIEEAFG